MVGRTDATRAPDDPCSPYAGCNRPNVWFRYTPSQDTALEIDANGSTIYAAACLVGDTGSFRYTISCSGDGQAHLFVDLRAGVQYWIKDATVKLVKKRR